MSVSGGKVQTERWQEHSIKCSVKAAALYLIRRRHASVDHLACLYTHGCEQRQIDYCRVGKYQDKMTWPHFDSLISLLHACNLHRLIPAHLNRLQSEPKGESEVRSWLSVDSDILVI